MADVTISAITKAFGPVAVLNGIDLSIADGEFVTLVGPSGCGKSTLLRIIAGLEPQSGGEIRIAGRPVDHLPPKRRDVAMVFQSYALYPYMTVAENVGLPLAMRRLNGWQRLPLIGRLMPGSGAQRRRIAAEVAEVATALGIDTLVRRKPGQLSGGQRQRVALARAMVRHPQVFLMDEPLSNLDAQLRVQMRAEIAELHRRLGATFIYVTHDQAEAMTMSDRVAVMLAGELIQVAPPLELYADPADLRVATFIGGPKINTLPAQIRRDGAVEIAGLALPLTVPGTAPGTRLTAGIRPEAIVPERSDDPVCWVGTVRHVEHLGADLYLHVRLGIDQTPVIVRADPEHAAGLRHDAAVRLRPLLRRVLLFDGSGRRVGAVSAAAPADLREAAFG